MSGRLGIRQIPCRQFRIDSSLALFFFEYHKDNSVAEPDRWHYRWQQLDGASGI